MDKHYDYIKTGDCSYTTFADWEHRILERWEKFLYLHRKFETTQPPVKFQHPWLGLRNAFSHYRDKCEPLWNEYRKEGSLATAQAFEDAMREAEEYAIRYALAILFDIEFKTKAR